MPFSGRKGIFGFDVKTRQETAIEFEQLKKIIRINAGYNCEYSKLEITSKPEQLSLQLPKIEE